MFGNSITIQQGISITVICMGVVFLVLMVLAMILENFKYISLKEEDRSNDVNVKNHSNNNQDGTDVLTNIENEDDLIAAIVASIAISNKNPRNKIQIKSIKRIG